MINVETLIKFLSKSGMRKIGVAVYMFAGFCWLLLVGVLPADYYKDLATMLILAVFAGNALEHYIKQQEKQSAEKAKEIKAP